ncbi:putative alcohol dehydrogenase [Thozetella sp. PMI_491]|nr:putative alcohol dehydrogenase [Thozetella sp. PMI_491]
MPTNRAAFQPAKGPVRQEVAEAPYPTPSEEHLVIRNVVVAINPVDWAIPLKGDVIMPHIKFPFILGLDVAGEVVEVGMNITRFRVGDRVVGIARAIEPTVNSAAEGGFQNYVILHPEYISPIPDHIKYEEAVVTGLALATAGTGLFDKKYLGLQLPTEPPQPPTGKTVVVWAGASSVGCAAIQLAVSAGYEVFSTSSPKNFEMVRSVGAAQVFDYRSPTVVADMVAALAGKTVVGALAIGKGSPEVCMQVMGGCSASSYKFVVLVSGNLNVQETSYVKSLVGLISWMTKLKIIGIFSGVKTGMVAPSQETTRHIYTKYLPAALDSGSFRPMPKPEIVGHGLEKIQEALDLSKKGGHSAKKLVVML